MKTLIFHHGALGDSVLVWPVLRAVGAGTLIAPGSRAALAAQWLANLEAIDIDSPDFSRLFAPAAEMEVADRVRALLGGAQCILSFVSDGDDPWAHNVRAMAAEARCVFLRARPNEDDPVEPIGAFHRRQLAEQGMTIEPIQPALRCNPHGPVVVHPGSGGRDKCWPADRFDALFEHFRNIGREVHVLLGPAEDERFDSAVLDRWDEREQTIRPASLIDLSRHIARAGVFIGNDSGPTHLASQLGVATVALFGPSDPKRWSPVGPAVRTLAPPKPAPMTWLAVEQVIQAAAMWG